MVFSQKTNALLSLISDRPQRPKQDAEVKAAKHLLRKLMRVRASLRACACPIFSEGLAFTFVDCGGKFAVQI